MALPLGKLTILIGAGPFIKLGFSDSITELFVSQEFFDLVPDIVILED